MKDILILSQYVAGLINEIETCGNDFSMRDIVDELKKIKDKVVELEEDK